MNYLYVSLAIMLTLVGVEQYGEHRVQVKWDKDKSVRQALLDRSILEGKEALDASKKQSEKDKRAATSKAGRDAVADYIHERGLLPSCDRLPSNTGDVPDQGSSRIDGRTEEPRASTALESFATDCAADALKVMRWQELCKANRCEVVE